MDEGSFDKKQIAYGARNAWAGAAIAQQLAEDDPAVFHPESQDRRRHLPKHVKQEVSRLRRIVKDIVVELTCWMDDHDDVNDSDTRARIG